MSNKQYGDFWDKDPREAVSRHRCMVLPGQRAPRMEIATRTLLEICILVETDVFGYLGPAY